MSLPRIRDMAAADVPPAVEMIARANWGARQAWFEFATSHPACSPIVAELEGELVGTGVGTENGPVGWVGTIFVRPDLRGGGLGRALTQAVIDRLEEAGCRTLVLVATDEGRRLYERMSFEVQTRYRILEAGGLRPAPPAADVAPDCPGVAVRAFGPRDLDEIAALDRLATGEDRRHALARFATSDTAKVVQAADGSLAGFVVRAPWGGGATAAPDSATALAILDARRRAAGPEGRVRVGVVDENAAGLEALLGAGLAESWSAPRMIRGAPLDWRPTWIWGQFNHAMG